MAHPLEFLHPETRFTPYEVIAIELTSLACEMGAAEVVTESDALKTLLHSWRNDIFLIRSALRDTTPEEATKVASND